MKEKPKAIFSWSGGKDSAYCLHKVLLEGQFDVKYLLTSINYHFKRVSMHGVREELLDAQADSIGLPLLKVWVKEGTNEEYEKQMNEVLLQAKSEGIGHVIFGDIFLEDLRAYRESNLAKVGMKAIFPLWQMNTHELVAHFIDLQFRTVLCCTNDGYLGEDWVGREIDRSFIEELPHPVDPCGENGEYHTFCYEGKIFKKKINFSIGEKVYKAIAIKQANDSICTSNISTKGFWFVDLVL
jgi:uncharacterized protein (TIGR00290 family)